MSRAKQRSTVYVVADSLDQAVEDLGREWGPDRRLGWVIDTGTPMTEPREIETSRSVARPMADRPASRRHRRTSLAIKQQLPDPRRSLLHRFASLGCEDLEDEATEVRVRLGSRLVSLEGFGQ